MTTYMTVEEIDAQIAELNREKGRLNTLRDQMLSNMVALYDLADMLHQTRCHRSHEDMCSWYYENGRENPWREATHLRYLEQAQAVVGKSSKSIEEIVEGIQILKDAGVL